MYLTRAELTDPQIRTFDRFLLDGTDRAIIALEQVFGLDIDHSDSNIEVAGIADSVFLSHLGEEKLYAVSCTMSGDLEGRISLLLRSTDFGGLGRVMRPVLNLLFLADPDDDLESLEQHKPDWLQSEIPAPLEDESYHGRMMDVLSELGNVLIGMYVKALYKAFRVAAHHTAPLAREAPHRSSIRGLVGRSGKRLHLVIENEFSIDDHAIGMWLLISPTRKSFRQLLQATRH